MSQRNVLKVVTAVAVMLATGVSATGQENRDTKEATKKLERLLVAAQGICPVMGKDLTKMGGPVKARVDKQTIFLCCKGCFKGKIKKGHWDQIQKNLIAAQGKCPVMGNPLPDKPASIVVSGRKVFVCCPPCTKKIQANPPKYLTVLNEMLAKNVGHERAELSVQEGQPPADPEPTAKRQIYTCPMHPEIQWTRPDACPICNMALVAKGAKTPPGMQKMHDNVRMSTHADEMRRGQPAVATGKTSYDTIPTTWRIGTSQCSSRCGSSCRH